MSHALPTPSIPLYRVGNDLGCLGRKESLNSEKEQGVDRSKALSLHSGVGTLAARLQERPITAQRWSLFPARPETRCCIMACCCRQSASVLDVRHLKSHWCKCLGGRAMSLWPHPAPQACKEAMPGEISSQANISSHFCLMYLGSMDGHCVK